MNIVWNSIVVGSDKAKRMKSVGFKAPCDFLYGRFNPFALLTYYLLQNLFIYLFKTVSKQLQVPECGFSTSLNKK